MSERGVPLRCVVFFMEPTDLCTNPDLYSLSKLGYSVLTIRLFLQALFEHVFGLELFLETRAPLVASFCRAELSFIVVYLS